MTQNISSDDNEGASGSQDTKHAVRFANGNSVANGSDSVQVIQSLGHSQITSNSNDDQQQQQPPAATPWADESAFNSFMEQSRAEQNALLDRIESLEATQQLGDTWGENNNLPAIDDVDDEKGNLNSINEQRSKSILRHKKETPWKYQKFPFPESTYTFFITENILSMPFLMGLTTVVMSLLCLGITLMNELDNSEDGNKYGMPAGVPKEVRIAQFLGIIIGEDQFMLEICFKCIYWAIFVNILTIFIIPPFHSNRRTDGRRSTIGTRVDWKVCSTAYVWWTRFRH